MKKPLGCVGDYVCFWSEGDISNSVFYKIVMNHIRFDIVPNSETNDHEVRIFVDGADWFDVDQMGMDPPELFTQLAECNSGQLLVGRCSCGVVGCGDVIVYVSRDAELVKWQVTKTKALNFDRVDYDAKIEKLLNDNSWENINRRVERLVTKQFIETKTEDDLSFDWASARIHANIIHLSYSKGSEQRLLEINWDGETAESALKRARAFKRERFSI